MAIRNKFHRGVSAGAFAIAMIGGLTPAGVLAQTAQAETQDDQDEGQLVGDEEQDKDENVIIVSGFRESLENAVRERHGVGELVGRVEVNQPHSYEKRRREEVPKPRQQLALGERAPRALVEEFTKLLLRLHR